MNISYSFPGMKLAMIVGYFVKVKKDLDASQIKNIPQGLNSDEGH